MPRLTRRLVKSAKPPTSGYVLIWDDQVRGFGLRVHSSGVRSFIVQYRDKYGAGHRMTIGRWGSINVETARKEAIRVFEDLRASLRDDNKLHPLAERRARIDAPTVGDLLDRYVMNHVEQRNRGTTADEVKRLIERHIRPRLGGHKVASVTRHDIAKLHHALGDTPRQANFVLAVCSKAFNLAEVWSLRPEGSNPCAKLERYRENARERFLSAEELGRLGDTLRRAVTEGLPWRVNGAKSSSKHLPKPEKRRTLYSRVTTAAIELLLFTGCRLSEVLNLRWDRVDLHAGIITLGETKSGRPQTVIINSPARPLLELLRATASPWVLPSNSDPKRPLSKTAIEGAWQRIRSDCGLEDVRLHDLRHTVGTYAGQSGANAFMVRDLLRHRDLAVTGRYVNRADDPVRALSDEVGARIAAGLAGRRGADVIPLKSTGGVSP